MFEQISATDVLKWTALVFAAGFIGFFGKYLGRWVLSLFHREKAEVPPPAGSPVKGVAPEGKPSEGELKILKKALKAKAKAEKKIGK